MFYYIENFSLNADERNNYFEIGLIWLLSTQYDFNEIANEFSNIKSIQLSNNEFYESHRILISKIPQHNTARHTSPIRNTPNTLTPDFQWKIHEKRDTKPPGSSSTTTWRYKYVPGTCTCDSVPPFYECPPGTVMATVHRFTTESVTDDAKVRVRHVPDAGRSPFDNSSISMCLGKTAGLRLFFPVRSVGGCGHRFSFDRRGVVRFL